MPGVVVVTHGRLAEELVLAAAFIMGGLEGVVGVGIDPNEPLEELKERILQAIRKVNDGEGVLVLTDMFGGTPSNICLAFLEEGRVEVVSGVNLPMIIKAAQSLKRPLPELAKVVAEAGKKSISKASELLNS
ncbi:PTS sugar transporter subunit IIA [Thermosulfuriphilus ammonigenes]|uniref:PTS sugar transporter subunit IIA n=1 Tax=Thermosulfuriphilus ammonigenes TaxID=1936021 RepID=A0A6G7PXF5_9BACT|nr:PTS sugar transporter subunit IIA [Thermosulfuriphilus ammonigenes]MBA2849633.1 PTS system mannose-specific IIA component [Thermosulfuriphilus ammonigenes]QIJ72267.1 PTS sugar transporter subunit IIA [Thermosulfuriphilus ammonigenes]HFB83697.1 PTS sugar transporter subunit IIA [Thermodesulfatator sp.]